MGIQKIIGGNDIKQGSIISHVDTVGGIDSIAAAFSNGGVNNSGVIVDRMKLNRYYSGDAAGGSTTVTYGITEGGDDGRWRTSSSYSHDPGASNIYGDPTKTSTDDYIGFDRY